MVGRLEDDTEEIEDGFAEIGEEREREGRGEGTGEMVREGRELVGMLIGMGDSLREGVPVDLWRAGEGAGEELGDPEPNPQDIRYGLLESWSDGSEGRDGIPALELFFRL
jgi:hypothetical protein